MRTPLHRDSAGRGRRLPAAGRVLSDSPSDPPSDPLTRLAPRGPGRGDRTRRGVHVPDTSRVAPAGTQLVGRAAAPSRLCLPIGLVADWLGRTEPGGGAGTDGASAGRSGLPHPLCAVGTCSRVWGPRAAAAPAPISLESQWPTVSGPAAPTLSSVPPKMTSWRTPACRLLRAHAPAHPAREASARTQGADAPSAEQTAS